MERKDKITLKKLAKLLDVSVSTVSKALHNSPEISPDTSKRIKDLAAPVHYIPKAVAQRPVKKSAGWRAGISI